MISRLHFCLFIEASNLATSTKFVALVRHDGLKLFTARQSFDD